MHISARRSALFVATAALLVGVTTPGFAKDHQGPRPVTTDGGVITYDKAKNQYCMTDTHTGSRIGQVTCKTKEQWAADGLIISRK